MKEIVIMIMIVIGIRRGSRVKIEGGFICRPIQ